MKKISIDLEKLKIEYLENKRCVPECAKIFGVSPSVIIRRLKEFNIKTRSGAEAKRIQSNIDDGVVVDLYWNQGLSIGATARALKSSERVIIKRLKESGRGTRSIADGIKKAKKSDHITNEQIIDLYENKKWSCNKISKYFGKSEDFVRQRFIKINKNRRRNTGEFNGSWKGGTTDVRNLIRGGTLCDKWRKNLYIKNNWKSEISNKNYQVLNVHHIYPFHIILKSVMTRYTILDGQNKSLAIMNDERFYDENNGMVLSEEEHHLVEKSPHDCHPYWKIWRVFPEFALKKFNFTEDDYGHFDGNGQINPKNSKIKESTKKEVYEIVRYEHYLGTIVFRNFILVSKIGDIITGIAVFGPSLNPRLPKGTIELLRLCIPYYVIRPFGCDFLKLCYKYIRANHPEIKELISFADPSVGHNGGIYRMAGWQKAGHGTKSYAYFDTVNNKLKHKVSCRRIKGIDKSEKQLAEENGLIKIPLPPKYRYIYPL